MHQYGTLEDTLYFGFASNLTTGAAGDGASPLFDVRLGGAAAGAAPVLSGTPTLLTHANYSDGCYEVAVAATAGNGFAADNTYLVFVTLTIDSVTPAAMIGSFRLAPVPANVTQLVGVAQSATDLKDFADDGYDPSANKVQGVVLVDTLTTYTGNTVQTGDSFARIGLPAGASVSADILVIDNLVDDLESRLGTPSNLGSGATVAANLVDIEGQTDDIGAAGAGLTAADDAILAILGTPAGASLAADIAAIEAQTDDIGAAGAGLTAVPWNAAWDAEVQSEVEDALIVHRLDELLNADSDIDGAAPPTVGSVFHELLTKTAGSFTYDQTTDSLEALRDNTGTAGAGLTVLATQASVDDLPTNAELATALGTADDAVLAAIAALNNLSQANIRTAVGLGAANLDTQLDALPTLAEIGALTITELVAIPGASPTLIQAIALQYMVLRNQIDVTATEKKVYTDAGAVLATKTLSDDGVVYSETKMA